MGTLLHRHLANEAAYPREWNHEEQGLKSRVSARLTTALISPS
jgi:hypothetical protein